MTEAEMREQLALLTAENNRLLGIAEPAMIDKPAKPRPITGEWKAIVAEREQLLTLSRLRNANRRLITCS